MNTNKIFFFDIDGTLAIHGKIPESNLKALEKLKEKGYLTFICTGRAGYYAKKLFKNLVSGYIACNGRYIIYHDEKIHGEQFSQDELNNYKKDFQMLNCGYMLVSDEVSCIKNLNEKQTLEIQNEYGKERIVFEEEDLPFYTFDLLYNDLDHRDKIIEHMKNKLVINDHGGHGSADCSTIGFDKGDGIAFVLKYFQISKENTYAFGDGYNDQAMFREVGHSIAMGNAVEELKEKATYITDSIENHGIYNALVHEKII